MQHLQPHGEVMTRKIIKRSTTIDRSKTSVTLEEPFWQLLKSYADQDGMTVGQYLTQVNTRRDVKSNGNFSSYVRVYLLQRVQLELCQALTKQTTQRTVEPFPPGWHAAC